jgi:hypothetical protein
MDRMKEPIDKTFVIECKTPSEAILHETMPVIGSLFKVCTITAERMEAMPMYFCVKVELMPVVSDDEQHVPRLAD